MNTIAIVDDHRLFVDGLVNLIKSDPELVLAFTANNASDMRSCLQKHSVDILLLDVNLPPDNGLHLLEEVKQQFPETSVMILSMYQPADINLKISHFAGDAYVLKTSGQEILENALCALKNKERFIDPGIIEREITSDNFTTELKLTKREKEIVSLMAMGKTTKEIAAQLFLSEFTVQTHRRNISEKIGTKGLSRLIYRTIDIQGNKRK